MIMAEYYSDQNITHHFLFQCQSDSSDDSDMIDEDQKEEMKETLQRMKQEIIDLFDNSDEKLCKEVM